MYAVYGTKVAKKSLTCKDSSSSSLLLQFNAHMYLYIEQFENISH